MMVDGKYHYICIVPQEWKKYRRSDLEKLLFKRTRKHFHLKGQIKGAVIKIKKVTTKVKYYNLKLWMKKIRDKSNYPDEKYFWTLMHW
uniref:BV6 family protein n=1 Tax=Microplitis mediator bracovirus TaxID=1836595 RepID=A0A1D5APD8_9VIRU|nr:hypothetical protein A6F54_3 [Microplitis mediator bracovirus]